MAKAGSTMIGSWLDGSRVLSKRQVSLQTDKSSRSANFDSAAACTANTVGSVVFFGLPGRLRFLGVGNSLNRSSQPVQYTLVSN